MIGNDGPGANKTGAYITASVGLFWFFTPGAISTILARDAEMQRCGDLVVLIDISLYHPSMEARVSRDLEMISHASQLLTTPVNLAKSQLMRKTEGV
jgi:hypothetical protein